MESTLSAAMGHEVTNASDRPRHLISLGAIEQADLQSSLIPLRDWLAQQNAARQIKIVDYLVGEELAGRGHLIKAYSLAIDVFGKGDDFDPAKSSLVRVEMRRLRVSLERYAAAGSFGAPYTFELPIGAYRLMATAAHHGAEGQPAPAIASVTSAPLGKAGRSEPDAQGRYHAPQRSDRRPHRWQWLVALPLIAALFWLGLSMFNHSAERAPDSGKAAPMELGSICQSARPIVGMFTALKSRGARDLPVSLADVDRIAFDAARSYPLATFVAGGTCPDQRFADLHVSVGAAHSEAGEPTYTVRSELRLAGGDAAIALRNGEVAFTETSPDLSLAIARTMFKLMEDPGDIPRMFAMQGSKGSAAHDVESYRCILKAKDFASNEIVDHYEEALQCIESLARNEQEHADIPSLYAKLLLYQKLGLVPHRTTGAEGRMAAAVAQARAINPADSQYLRVQIQSLRHGDHVNRASYYDLLSTMRTSHPFEPFIVGQAGRIDALYFGKWDEGLTQISRARSILQRRSNFPYFDLAYAIVKQDRALAGEAAKLVIDNKVPLYAIQGFACAHLADEAILKQRALRNLQTLGFGSHDSAAREVRRAQFDPSLEEPLLALLSEAMPK